EEWQQKLFQNEIHYLRGLADLQASLDVRVARVDDNYRTALNRQHSHFESALRQATDELQKRFWADLDKIRLEYEALIHTELRVTRQKAFAAAASATAPVNQAPAGAS